MTCLIQNCALCSALKDLWQKAERAFGESEIKSLNCTTTRDGDATLQHQIRLFPFKCKYFISVQQHNTQEVMHQQKNTTERENTAIPPGKLDKASSFYTEFHF